MLDPMFGWPLEPIPDSAMRHPGNTSFLVYLIRRRAARRGRASATQARISPAPGLAIFSRQLTKNSNHRRGLPASVAAREGVGRGGAREKARSWTARVRRDPARTARNCP